MRIWTIIIQAFVCLAPAVPVLAQNTPPTGGGMAMKQYKVDAFFKQVDADRDGSMSKEEWKNAGLADLPFTLCDTGKDGNLTTKEMTDCKLPEAMDTDGNGVLMVSEMIAFDKQMASAPKQKYVPSDPYVEGGATGMDFIKLFDKDNDGKVTHEEWEQTRPSTVFKDKHWPDYNKNMDEFITVDEAPQKPRK
jgi:hypothetical protein